MSAIDHLLTEAFTITRVSTSGTNTYGEAAAAQAAPVNALGYLTQESTTELLDGRDTIVSRWMLYTGAATAIGALDFITFQSQTFQVEGAPEQCYNPRTKIVSHQRAQLVVVSG